jgi:Transglycosylase SLT domain
VSTSPPKPRFTNPSPRHRRRTPRRHDRHARRHDRHGNFTAAGAELASPTALEPLIAPAVQPVTAPAASAAPQTAPTSTDDLAIDQAPALPSTTATEDGAADLTVGPFASVPLAQFPWSGVEGLTPPAFLIPIYKAAGQRYDVPWQILAAINSIETDYGRDLSVSPAGAIGWMQFMPATWLEYGVDPSGSGQPNPYNPQDAIFSAAHYLAANGAAQNLPGAILAYNHAEWYVAEVMLRAQIIGDLTGASTDTALASRRRTGLAGAETMLAAAASAVGGPYSQANHDSFGQTAAELRIAGTDCSGFVSWVLDQVDPGFGNQTTVTLPNQPGVLPGVGQYVTIWDRPLPGDEGHVIINILGTWFESGGNTAYNPAGGIAPMSEAQALGELSGGGFLPYHLAGM